VNVSRHKFSGLVGHDLIWCLYCDWMTGVWVAGDGNAPERRIVLVPHPLRQLQEMRSLLDRLPRCPARLGAGDANMADVTRVLEQQYPPTQLPRAWFGSPVRITVRGREADPRVNEELAPVGANGD
jgi:hypothetical protein